MARIDLKRTPKEIADEQKEMVTPEVDQYPWGLRINLDEETLAKLPPEMFTTVGTEMTLTVIGKVSSVSVNDTNEGTERRACFQITGLEVPDAKPSRAERMYGKDGTSGE